MTVVVSRVGNLPAAFTTFVGRRREVTEVCRLLGRARLVTLTGVGGIGKTRLALEAAVASAEAFPDGVWLVDLAAVREPSAVVSTAATALGVPDLGSRPALEQLAVRLAGRRALVVLDNCEHLVDACGELANGLLSAAAEVCVLATSRQTLGIVGEHVYTVPPLPPKDAVELLRDRTTAVRPEFRITDETSDAVSRLCADLDGMPLAIELAASRLRTLSVEQVLERLEDRFALLTGGSRTALLRQRTLRAAIEWSYELCSPAERLLWNRLSVFAGGFALEAAEGVCSGEGVEAKEVLDLLDRLISQSVVLTAEAEGLPRYRLLETIREYGRERLAESGEKDLLRLRHRDFHLALAQRVADRWYGPGQEQALARLRADHADLLAALDCPGDPQATLAMAAALRYHWCVGGFLGEGYRRLDRALADAPEPTSVRAGGLLAAAWVATLQGGYAPAARWLDEADELGGRLGDPAVRAHVRTLRGTIALFEARMKEALPLFEEGVAAFAALGRGSEAVLTLVQLTNVRTLLRDPRAAESGRQALAVAEAQGDRWGYAIALWALALVAYWRGELESAMELTRDAFEIERGFVDYVGVVMMLEMYACMTASCGDYERAARQLGAAGALWRDVGTPVSANPQLAEHHARCEQEIVRALGQAAYEKAFAAGNTADGPAQAIALALDTGSEPAAPAAASSPLTPREREVAALVAQGMSNKQIATVLGRSPRTVDGHIQSILDKLSFGSRAQIAAWWVVHQTVT